MKAIELIKHLRNAHPDSEILIFPSDMELVDEDGTEQPLHPGIGYYDPESHDFVYIGEVNVVEETDDDANQSPDEDY